MSFVGLVSTTVDIPFAMYMLFTQSDVAPMQQQNKFIDVIRESVWSRIQFEKELQLSSFDSLWWHWLRSCLVSNMGTN